MGNDSFFIEDFSVRFRPVLEARDWLRGMMMRLQAAVDPLDGVTLIFSNDALLNVGFNLLVHEVLQLGQVIIWGGQTDGGLKGCNL